MAIGRRFKGLSEGESAKMAVGKEKSATDFCRICGHCLPCPAKIAISDILRLELNARHYGLNAWAKREYSRQKVKADVCTKCGKCTERCPHGLPAMDRIQRAATTLV